MGVNYPKLKAIWKRIMDDVGTETLRRARPDLHQRVGGERLDRLLELEVDVGDHRPVGLGLGSDLGDRADPRDRHAQPPGQPGTGRCSRSLPSV